MLSVSEIITFSSNIGAVKIGQRIGYKKFHEYLERFGFGTEQRSTFRGAGRIPETGQGRQRN